MPFPYIVGRGSWALVICGSWRSAAEPCYIDIQPKHRVIMCNNMKQFQDLCLEVLFMHCNKLCLIMAQGIPLLLL